MNKLKSILVDSCMALVAITFASVAIAEKPYPRCMRLGLIEASH